MKKWKNKEDLIIKSYGIRLKFDIGVIGVIEREER